MSIITIGLGQCGNRNLYNFWQKLVCQHGLTVQGSNDKNSDGKLVLISSYFSELQNREQLCFRPRTVFSDSQSEEIQKIKASPHGKLFRPQSFVSSNCSTGSNWAKGFYTFGYQQMQYLMDSIRKQTQISDSLQGFQIFHSLGGGTGSGQGSLLIQKLKDQFSVSITQTFSFFPSTKVSDNVVQPYNCVLAMNYLIEYIQGCFCIDNQALYQICRRNRLPTPTYKDLNKIVARASSNASSSLRFPSADKLNLNSSLRKMAINLNPFPRAQFYLMGLAPFGIRMLPYSAIQISQQLYYYIKFLKNLHDLSEVLLQQSEFKFYHLEYQIISTIQQLN